MKKTLLILFVTLFLTSCQSLSSPISPTIQPASTITPMATPTDDRVIYTPPIKIKIKSNNELDFVIAANSISNLVFFERNIDYKASYENRVKAKQLSDNGYIFYILDGAEFLLHEYDGDFAQIEFIEASFDNRPGDIGWVKKENISQY